jgi:hypothetical protein
VRGLAALLNKKGILASTAASLLPRTPLPGKRFSKMALSSSSDRSRKNPEFPYAGNYAVRVNPGMNYRQVLSSPIFIF